MRLVTITAGDGDLAVCLECDPEMLRHIGGSRQEADVRASHKHRLDLMEQDEAGMYNIVADSSDEVPGTIGIWRIDWKGPQTYEVSWFVLPEHQGKGVATEAAHILISQERSNHEARTIHALSCRFQCRFQRYHSKDRDGASRRIRKPGLRWSIALQ